MSSDFDRLRPRRPRPPGGGAPGEMATDAHGKRALFSTAAAVPTAGSVVVDCSRCGQQSVVSIVALARAGIPSLHLPYLRRYGSWLRCPACERRSWVRLRLRG